MDLLSAALVWLRRDLRLADNPALHAALTQARKVYCVFVFDTEILESLPSRRDRRVEFIRASLVELDDNLAARGSGLMVRHGAARVEIPRLASTLGVAAVFANRDYEPHALARDAAVEKHFGALAQIGASRVPTLAQIGFETTNFAHLGVPSGASGAEKLVRDFLRRVDRYHELRDYPAIRGTSYLSLHLRFGTVSVRRLTALAAERKSEGARAWLGELIWRDYYFAILHAYPHVTAHAFRRTLDAIAFPNDPGHFAAWCEGRTGYPLVDAAMRQLVGSGFMSNRLRMLTASFLVKDLHVDWRWGERFFARHLNDYDLAANVGNWQWVASTGSDAQPYFRVFNPVVQSEKFDRDGIYIRRYVPELAGLAAEHIHAPWQAPREALQAGGVTLGETYPAPIVDHARSREIALALYRARSPQ